VQQGLERGDRESAERENKKGGGDLKGRGKFHPHQASGGKEGSSWGKQLRQNLLSRGQGKNNKVNNLMEGERFGGDQGEEEQKGDDRQGLPDLCQGVRETVLFFDTKEENLGKKNGEMKKLQCALCGVIRFENRGKGRRDNRRKTWGANRDQLNVGKRTGGEEVKACLRVGGGGKAGELRSTTAIIEKVRGRVDLYTFGEKAQSNTGKGRLGN